MTELNVSLWFVPYLTLQTPADISIAKFGPAAVRIPAIVLTAHSINLQVQKRNGQTLPRRWLYWDNVKNYHDNRYPVAMICTSRRIDEIYFSLNYTEKSCVRQSATRKPPRLAQDIRGALAEAITVSISFHEFVSSRGDKSFFS